MCAYTVHCKTYMYIHTHGCFCYDNEPPDSWTSDISVAPFREEVDASCTNYICPCSLPDIFTMTLMGVIVEQTNIYACHILGESRPWREVTAEELWAFLWVLHPNGDEPPPCHSPLLELGPPTSLRAGGRTHHSR